jgi:hypothetical protein
MALLRALAVLVGTLVAVTASGATITRQFDETLIGDDPREDFNVANPFLANFPLQVSFNGYVESLSAPPYENDMLVGFSVNGTSYTQAFHLLPRDSNTGPVQVPIAAQWTLNSTPPIIEFFLEGLGNPDNFHVVGTLSQTGNVPEPSTSAILLGALPLGYLVGRRRRAIG